MLFYSLKSQTTFLHAKWRKLPKEYWQQIKVVKNRIAATTKSLVSISIADLVVFIKIANWDR